MPLTMARTGETRSILRIIGKGDTQQHLAELGFVVGSEVTLVTKIGGNVILAIKNSRIALDMTMAKRIMI